jgi:hypothetical protein
LGNTVSLRAWFTSLTRRAVGSGKARAILVLDHVIRPRFFWQNLGLSQLGLRDLVIADVWHRAIAGIAGAIRVSAERGLGERQHF